MADRLPKFVALESVPSGGYVYFMNQTNAVRGYVGRQESVFNPFAKIEVEPAKTGDKFVHLRFCHSNKYWARRGPNADDHWIAATSDHPEEDTSKLSCTLFEPTLGMDARLLYLTHVQSGGRVRTDVARFENMSSRLYVDDSKHGDSFHGNAFAFVDWETLVKLPKRVTFIGDNGKYLKSTLVQRLPYLQFSSDDGSEKATAYEVQLHPDGHVRVKSEHFGKFWRRSPNWIWADSTDSSGGDIDTLFWPVKVEGSTIALRNAGNNYFCKRLTADNKTSCLNAAVPSITREARLVVEELVLQRNIYNVRYRMEEARVFDEKPFLAGVGTAINETDVASSLTIKVAYKDSRSYSFSNSLSIKTGVKTTIQTGLPRIVEGKIEISSEVTNSFEWERSTAETKTSEATFTVSVPARSRARVNYVGTHGRCSVPFSYTQRDKSSSDGQLVTSQHVDGIYTGVNYYSFRFEQLAIEPLPGRERKINLPSREKKINLVFACLLGFHLWLLVSSCSSFSRFGPCLAAILCCIFSFFLFVP